MISYRHADLIDKLNLNKNYIGAIIMMVPGTNEEKSRTKVIGIDAKGNLIADDGVYYKEEINGLRDGFVFIDNPNGAPHIGKELCLRSGGCLGKITNIRDGIYYTDKGHRIKSEEHGYQSQDEERLVI